MWLNRLLFILCFGLSASGLSAQVNLENLSFSVDDYNTLSYTTNGETLVIGKSQGCLVKSSSGQELLSGNHAIILSKEKGICTFKFFEDEQQTIVYWYSNELNLLKEFQIAGEVNSIACNKTGDVLYLGVENSSDLYLAKLELFTGQETQVYETNLPLNVVAFKNGKIGVGGPITYIFRPNEKLDHKIYLPHLGYLKNDYESDTLKVLSRISDASFIDLYTKKGYLIKSLKFEHSDSMLRVMCSECERGVAMINDFSISRNGLAIIAKDQFNMVYQLDANGKLIKYYSLSHNWMFLHFNGHGVLRYFDKSTETINEFQVFDIDE